MLNTKPDKDKCKTVWTKKLNKAHPSSQECRQLSVTSIWLQDKFCLGSTSIEYVSQRDYDTLLTY